MRVFVVADLALHISRIGVQLRYLSLVSVLMSPGGEAKGIDRDNVNESLLPPVLRGNDPCPRIALSLTHSSHHHASGAKNSKLIHLSMATWNFLTQN